MADADNTPSETQEATESPEGRHKRIRKRPYLSEKGKAYYARTKDRQRANRKRNYADDPKRQKEEARAYYWKNREKVLAQKASDRAEAMALDLDKVRELEAIKRARRDPAAVTDGMRDYMRRRRASDPIFRMTASLRSRIGNAIRLYGTGKKYANTTTLIGCTIPELIVHIESQFESWMSWDNYGRRQDSDGRSWVIDHRKPLASFDLSNAETQRVACHFSNLSPLESAENIRKGKRLDWTPPLKKAA